MSLMEANGEHLIQIFDPTEAYGRELVDGRGENGEAVPKTGVFNDFDTEAIREVRLYDASDNLVTGSLSSAAKAVLENQQGETLTFDVFDQASTGPAWLTDAARGNVVQLEGNHFCAVEGYQGIAGSAERTCAGCLRQQKKGAKERVRCSLIELT